MPIKQVYILTLSAVGWVLLTQAGFAQNAPISNQPRPAAAPFGAQLGSTQAPGLRTSPVSLSFSSPNAVLLAEVWDLIPDSSSSPRSTPTPTPTPTPTCLDKVKASVAIEKVLTPEQAKLAKVWTAQGKSPKQIIADLKLTREQKKALRNISRQQCKTPTP